MIKVVNADQCGRLVKRKRFLSAIEERFARNGLPRSDT